MKTLEPVRSGPKPVDVSDNLRRDSACKPAPVKFLCLHEAMERLRRQVPDPALEAIPWMHLKHPIHPVQKALLQDASGWERKGGGNFSWLLRALLSLLYAGYFTLRLVQMRLRFRRVLNRLIAQPFDGIVKSWRFHPDRTASTRDFYFGDFGERLGEQGSRVLFLFGNPSGKSWQGPAVRAKAPTPELPELCLIPLGAPIRFAWGALKTSRRLRRRGEREKDRLSREILLRAAQDCLLPQSVPVALFEEIGREAARIWHPRFFASLYEGHAWEGFLFRGIQLVHPGCRRVGYQHTILLPHQRSLLAPEIMDAPSRRPEVVLCVGHRTCEMLAASHPHSARLPFGTFRKLPGCPAAACPPVSRRKTVLVLPEGHLDETQLLFDAALGAAQVLTDHHFILRSHPVLPFDRVRPLLQVGAELAPNAELSDSRSIEEDFSRASVVLYRGTSSVLFALLNGLKVIYFQPEGWDEVDPLFELEGWRERAESVGTLQTLLRQYAKANTSEAAQEWNAAKGYVERYAIPVNEHSMRQFLGAVG